MCLKVLSLGGGVQSSALLLMSELGELPRLDAAVFADTGWEPIAVYENIAWLQDYCTIPVHVVKFRNLRDDVMEFGRSKNPKIGYHIPAWTKSIVNGHKGKLFRQCTRDYKMRPIERFVKRELLGLRKGQRAKIGSVIQWLGISADEMKRVRQSREPWQILHYPLCNLPDTYFDKPKTRRGCIEWLSAHFPDRTFHRSACIGCPYHSDEEWRRVKESESEWADAVEVDETIRGAFMNKHPTAEAECFLHPSLRPLAQVDLSLPVMLPYGNECLGNCHT